MVVEEGLAAVALAVVLIIPSVQPSIQLAP
jgi:hypothetical protein